MLVYCANVIHESMVTRDLLRGMWLKPSNQSHLSSLRPMLYLNQPSCARSQVGWTPLRERLKSPGNGQQIRIDYQLWLFVQAWVIGLKRYLKSSRPLAPLQSESNLKWNEKSWWCRKNQASNLTGQWFIIKLKGHINFSPSQYNWRIWARPL